MLEKHIEIGRNWVEKHWLKRELYHHGVKGQKWGVKNGPPYPLKNSTKAIRSTEKSMLIEEEIRDGKISKTINKDKQKRHTKDEHTPGRSYLYGDTEYAQDLVNRLSGTGRLVYDSNGNWNHKEMVSDNKVIGSHVDPVTGNETDTKNGTIVYSKTGSHIFPRQKGG